MLRRDCAKDGAVVCALCTLFLKFILKSVYIGIQLVTGPNTCSEGVTVLMEVMVAAGVEENTPWERLPCAQVLPVTECAFLSKSWE